MSYNQNKSVELRIDGKRVANLEKFEVNCIREIVEENGVQSANLSEVKIVFRRAICFGDTISDGVILKALKSFKLEVYVPQKITTYNNCLCTGYREIIGEGNKIIEEITATASSYLQSSR